MAFTKALSDELGALKAERGAISAADWREAERRVIDRWIAEGKQEALVRYLVENYDGAEGGEEWFHLLGEHLAKTGEVHLIGKLYQPVIDRRRNHYFWRLDQLEPHWPVPDVINRLLDRFSSRRRKVAQYKLAVMALMHDFRAAAATSDRLDVSKIDQDIAAFAAGKKPPRRSKTVTGDRMDPRAFWTLIGKAGADASSSSDVVSVIEESLEAMPPPAIERFQKILNGLLDSSYRWDLWAVAYAVRGGCGDDEFDYFREWLILQGKDTYEAAIADPVGWAVTFPFEGDPQCEGLSSAAPNAYREKTGKSMLVKREHPAKPAGEAWTEQELPARFPELASHFALN